MSNDLTPESPKPTKTHLSVTATQWAGPLPPPQVLQQYNDIVPGGAERILRMAEAEQSHRLNLVTRGQMAAIGDTKRGHYLGTGISVVALLGAAGVAVAGGPWAVGVAMVGVPVFAAVRALLDHRSKK